MKTLKSLALATAILMSSLAFADVHSKEKKAPLTVGQTVAELLSDMEVDLTHYQDVMLKFYVNEYNEIVVLDVDTQDRFLKRFITYRLNYEKISSDLVTSKNHFKILLKFKALD